MYASDFNKVLFYHKKIGATLLGQGAYMNFMQQRLNVGYRMLIFHVTNIHGLIAEKEMQTFMNVWTNVFNPKT